MHLAGGGLQQQSPETADTTTPKLSAALTSPPATRGRATRRRCTRLPRQKEIAPIREEQTRDATDERDSPADKKAGRIRPHDGDCANRGHDQIAEHKQNAGDADESGHHDAEGGVKEKIPPAHSPTPPVSFLSLKGDQQEIFPENEMDGADDKKNGQAFPDFCCAHDGDVADEHVADLFVAMGGPAEQEHGGRGAAT
jgi:hypothetical protein